jgi:2,4-dienoyl-CoA reductase-like NADH-dependent reductase (Old Yellow Enzyme family)
VPLFREVVPREVALVAAGNVWSRQDAERLVELGADVVSVGRAAILDPDWPQRVGRDGREPVRPPRTAAQLAEVAISPGFVEYLRRFRGLVA